MSSPLVPSMCRSPSPMTGTFILKRNKKFSPPASETCSVWSAIRVRRSSGIDAAQLRPGGDDRYCFLQNGDAQKKFPPGFGDITLLSLSQECDLGRGLLRCTYRIEPIPVFREALLSKAGIWLLISD